jgi:predicted adenylyl cyclase CyaB
MSYLNIEIKAKCSNPAGVRKYLQGLNAEFKGTDTQTDTYFNVPAGRLKLREGNIENNLIFYERQNQKGPKDSHFHLSAISDPGSMKNLLVECLGVKVAVVKKREIYYIKNVKFHIDEVQGLGSFVEIEAGNILADLTRDQLAAQCDFYMKELQIEQDDLIHNSYSDLLIS